MSQYLSLRLTITETDVGPSRRRRRLKIEMRQWRHSFFVFCFSIFVQSNEKRKTVCHTDFRFSDVTRKSENGYLYRISFFFRNTKIEKRNTV